MVEIESPMPAPFPNPASASGSQVRPPQRGRVRANPGLLRPALGLRTHVLPAGVEGRRPRRDDDPRLLPARPRTLSRTHHHEAVARHPEEPQDSQDARDLPRNQRQAALPQGLPPPARQVRVRAAGRAGRPAHIAGSLLRAAGRAEGGGTRQGALSRLRGQAARRWSASSAEWSASWPT